MIHVLVSGKVRVIGTLDGKSETFELRDGDKAARTTFDRFGIVN
jgi:hypothetical protein